jgi:RNA polymerase sigma-70 factor (ECF subfamily)
MSTEETPNALRDDLRTAWHRYVDMLAPQRPALHGYCRRLTGNLWDAEDLVQDTLLRAFAHLGLLNHDIGNLRAYLLRTATNAWIDELRRRECAARVPGLNPEHTPDKRPDPAAAGELRDAASRLLQRLAPQERAAVLLKECFDLSLEEIAEVLATTTGAVKAALHRGRGRLNEPEGAASSRRPAPSAQLVDRFLERYRAGDLKGLAELLLDGASVENVGEAFQFGRASFERSERNILHHLVHGHPEWPPEFQPDAIRALRAEYEGEPMLLWLVTRRGREALEVVMRFAESEGRIARLRTYAFCPETMRAIGEALGLRVRTGLYRAPTPAPGLYWPARARHDPVAT